MDGKATLFRMWEGSVLPVASLLNCMVETTYNAIKGACFPGDL